MNKTKLEVIKINEDVIATSGALAHCYSLELEGVNNGSGDYYLKVTNSIFKENDNIDDNEYIIGQIQGKTGLFLLNTNSTPYTTNSLTTIDLQNGFKYIYSEGMWVPCLEHSDF